MTDGDTLFQDEVISFNRNALQETINLSEITLGFRSVNLKVPLSIQHFL